MTAFSFFNLKRGKFFTGEDPENGKRTMENGQFNEERRSIVNYQLSVISLGVLCKLGDSTSFSNPEAI
jgi:hypothetical protein